MTESLHAGALSLDIEPIEIRVDGEIGWSARVCDEALMRLTGVPTGVLVEANGPGFASLAQHCLTLAQDGAPGGLNFEFSALWGDDWIERGEGESEVPYYALYFTRDSDSSAGNLRDYSVSFGRPAVRPIRFRGLPTSELSLQLPDVDDPTGYFTTFAVLDVDLRGDTAECVVLGGQDALISLAGHLSLLAQPGIPGGFAVLYGASPPRPGTEVTFVAARPSSTQELLLRRL